MDRIRILDCTLRDGGYINHFKFGQSAIQSIIQKLSSASIDIIECGFLRSQAFDPDCTLFGSIDAIKKMIGKKNPNLMYVGMIQYGKIRIDEITPYDGTSIDGIRLTFHEHEIDESFVMGKQLMDKGYKLFMQPVGTTTYSDEALLKLIARINEIKPYAFYLVDTLGIMYKNDLLRMFYLIDHNLDKHITLGFHSHNNLQLSFANAQELMQLNTPRKLIIDSSVFGMGRGAGNLNTELVTQYINFNFGLKYDNIEILEIIDEYIRPLSFQYKWGYDAAYYIASVTGCHPNYASLLMNKQTLHVQDIHAILNGLAEDKRALFDKKYIEEKYVMYMNHHVDDHEVRQKLKERIREKQVVLLAPGKSLKENAVLVQRLCSDENCFVMSVNFVPENIEVDAAFISNMKRFKSMQELIDHSMRQKLMIVTSNILTESAENIWVINYASYINEDARITDIAGLMCIQFLKKIGVRKIMLAGFDGFSSNQKDNYYESSMMMNVEEERLADINFATAKKMAQLKKQMDISFLTETFYNE